MQLQLRARLWLTGIGNSAWLAAFIGIGSTAWAWRSHAIRKAWARSPCDSARYQRGNREYGGHGEEGMDAVERLKSGFEEFKTSIYDKKPELFEPLKAGQAPRYMVFACADSRVCPSVTLGLQPGEAFTIRNIAAMVPPYDKNRYTGIGSAIEYAVCALKVEVLVVIGHSKCGGIKALLSLQDGAADNFHFVEDWVRIGHIAKKKVQSEHASVPFDDQCTILEKEAVNVSLDNLLTYPWVKEGVAQGTLKLVGGHYNFVDGEFLTWEK